YLNYHAEMGKCLVKGAQHEPNAGNNACCAFVWNPTANELWHQCFAAGCQVKGRTKTALANLGVDPDNVLRWEAASAGPQPPLVVSTAADFLRREFRAKEVFFEVAKTREPAIAGPFTALLHAYRGVGKSNFAFGFAAALAQGREFLVFKAPKKR